ncbi:hypothetical protein HBH56_013440 [Parastagonospora nodorum]|uniref:Uncharacterized protein n=1 Tax=Phaeosphaeria nodorum (strain SN15 / ATCC MYA-4574 / FGSC 10173) TaxID=321614 RepID=A0A7U2EXI5_PHANO|nr:hypothetical protein HBH56_013440 [Parastagonospora nodorum]QRC94870.1 hypothetical protein JI435_026150 [Parastagonospora nodorum SN15]KAH3937018.1 hypothetical protein HBH54_021000 [Parastagonospora nodorum]KAH3969448.1 hypothetical protein HBH51_125560 [Parastagonospora nodorum]KAH4100754.1 hypothetical protein HBH46_149270 [Parastagonospora nodorum]
MGLPSPLLSLPAELRNKIYELVLSEAEGLEYVRDAVNAARLCSYSPQVDSKDVVPGQIEADSAALASTVPRTHGHRIIANQLQYVCRQLRFETKGLEVLYNSVTFTSPRAAMFRLFVDSLHLQLEPQNYAHDFVLRVAEDQKWPANIFRELSSFFLAYPRCMLKIYHPNLASTKPSSLLFTALLVKYGSRNDMTFLPKITNDLVFQQSILNALPEQVKNEFITPMPKNIVIFPHDTLDEAAFRHSCNNHGVIRRILLTKTDGGLDELVEIAKDLYSHGF